MAVAEDVYLSLYAAINPPVEQDQRDDIQDIARAILAERSRDRWLPFETAPKDGTRVLCWNKNWQAPESGCLYGVTWAANGLAADKGGWKYQPTHWQPLPNPPITS